MKKKLALVVAAAMAVSAFTMNSYADDEYTEVSVVIDGGELEIAEGDQPAVIVDSRTMVPVRAIADALGVEVAWDGETKTATFDKGDASVDLTIGETTVKVTAGEVETEQEIDVAAVIINERTMVPARFVSEFFSADVDWNEDTKTVTISTAAAVADDAASDSAVDADTEETTEAAEDSEETTAADEDTEETTEAVEETSEEDEEAAAEDSEEESSDEDADSEETTEETAEETTEEE
ncbi:MAG: copper amine oxidase N-terminal domain-containing protein [Clostridiales bacterium]|nr:copper amine oxidase N-terminal domain-containing protein [Clostridiales bacterium]